MQSIKKSRSHVSDEYKVLFTPPYIALEILGVSIFLLGIIRIF